MSINKKIRPCPQHAAGPARVRPAYLLRTCPACMKWLGEHPEDARLARQFIPGAYASPIQGAYNALADRAKLKRAAARAAEGRA